MRQQLKAIKNITVSLALATTLAMMVSLPAPVQAENFKLDDANLSERLTYHRAIDSVVWAMPLMSFKGYRDALINAGVGPNDVGYFSQLQDWKLQAATPNNTTPYILTHWNFKDGPIVIELPPSVEGIGLFGTLLDAWQRSIDDVGAKGRDRGRGATYLMVPPNYDGPLLPGALVYEQETYHGWLPLRPIMKGGATPENLAKAVELTKKVKVYPLSQANSKPKTQYVDLYGKLLEMIPKLDGGIYQEISDMIQEEVVLDRDLSMMGVLSRIGIEKGQAFKPEAKLQTILDQAAPEALEHMIQQYHRVLNPWMWEGKKWSMLVPSGAKETDMTYEYPGFYDFNARGALFYAILSSVKSYGGATFYLDCAETEDGQWLDGSKNYKLVMPADVPVSAFWAITAYDLESASTIRQVSRNSIDSLMKTVKKNADGTVDIFFGPKPPKGKESNWLPTVPKRRWFMLARFYGPKPALYSGEFQLNNVKLVK